MRHPVHVLVPAVLGLAVGLAFGVSTRHRATASIAVELTSSSGTLSPATAAEVLRRRIPAITNRVSEAARAEGVADAVEVGAVGANRIDLTCVAGRAAQAAACANRLAAVLAEQSSPPRQEDVLTRGSEDLERRLADVREALEKNRGAIEQARRIRAATPDSRAGNAWATKELRAEHADLTSRLRAAEAKLEELRRTGPEAAEPSDPELVRLRLELTALLERYTDQHPDVEAVRRRIAEREATATSAQAAAALARRAEEVRSVEGEVEDLAGRLARLETDMAALGPPRKGSVTVPAGDIDALQREQTALEETQVALSRNLAAARLAGTRPRGGPSERFRVLRTASHPGASSFPTSWVFSLIGLLTGLAMGECAALVAESRDRTVKNKGDLESLLQLPVLAEIPLVPNRRAR